jgi:UPF0755 protein
MRNRKIFAVFIVVFTVLLTTFSFYGYQILKSPNILVDKTSQVFIIPKDATFSSVRDSLYTNDFVQDIVSFSFLARLMDYDVSIKPGRYVLEPNMSNVDAIRLLRAGIQVPVKITYNNVRLISDLAEKITRGIEIDQNQFIKAYDDYSRNNTLGLTRETAFCIFIPNTYEVWWNISADGLVERMEFEYENFWTSERVQKANDIGLTPINVSILASIVQAETRIKSESPQIAGLYINRLQKNMYLQADPTLVYAVGDFTLKRVLNIHKEIDSPYNTYKNKGLPPGPINLPEIWAIDAVLNYRKHSYIYMCAKEDFSGYHNFATNLTEHNRNAQKYQRALSIEQRKARQNAN